MAIELTKESRNAAVLDIECHEDEFAYWARQGKKTARR